MISFLRGVPAKLKTITDYLTTNMAAARMAFLDAAVSTRAPASGALSDAVWTGTKAGYLDAAISSRAAASPLILPPIAANFGYGSGTKAGVGYSNALSITGSGVLSGLGVFTVSGAGVSATRLTIDGVVVATKSGNGSVVGYFDGSNFHALDLIPFKTSLLIEVSGDTLTTGGVFWFVRRAT